MNTYDASGNQICRVDQLRIKYREIGTNSWSQKNIGSPTGYDPVTGICVVPKRQIRLFITSNSRNYL